MTEPRSIRLTVRGSTVHVLKRGTGRPVLLLHGNGSAAQEVLSAFPPEPGLCLIAPDRPGFGQSESVPPDRLDPWSMAGWVADLLTGLNIPRARIVAHSLAAGMALNLSLRFPHRVQHLVLLSPFCRPTPHRWLPALRLAVAPVVGGFIRRNIVPPLVRVAGQRILRAYTAPNPPPPWLRDLPLDEIARPSAIVTTAGELRAFNAGMRRGGLRPIRVPVTVVHGAQDRTADPDWHLPWLRQRAPQMRCLMIPGAGHAVHHAHPELVRAVVRQST